MNVIHPDELDDVVNPRLSNRRNGIVSSSKRVADSCNFCYSCHQTSNIKLCKICQRKFCSDCIYKKDSCEECYKKNNTLLKCICNLFKK